MLLLAIIPPFLVAGLIALSPRISLLDRNRRLAAAGSLLLVFAGLFALAWSAQRDQVLSLAVEAQYGLGYGLNLCFDQTALHFALLLASSQIVLLLTSYKRIIGRSDALFLLCSVGVAIASVAAADLWTLLLGWGLLDIGLLAHHARRTDADLWRAGRQQLWVSLLSTLHLLLALIVLPETFARASWSDVFQQRTVWPLLLTAAWLRLGVYPLPGYTRKDLAQRIVNLCVGGALWMRIVDAQAIPTAWHPALLIVATGGLLGIAMLATDTFTDRDVTHVLSYGIAMMILGPLLSGVGIGYIQTVTAFVILSVTLCQGGKHLQDLSAEIWGRIVECLGLLTLLGLPLSLGFAGHGALLVAAVLSPWPAMAWIIVLAYMMLSWSLVRQMRSAMRGVELDRGWRPLLRLGLAFIGLAVLQVLLLFVPWFGWGQLFGVGLPRDAFRIWLEVMALTTIIPALAAAAMWVWSAQTGLLVNMRAIAYWLLDWDWLHALADGVLVPLQRFIRWVYEAIEEMVPLAWAIVWLLGIALYLFQRQSVIW